MITQKPLIFTDLDGTLLDHYSYQYTPALASIEQLKKAQVPIIFTTSKTLAEVVELQSELAIDAPLIIENGAAVYIPKTVFKEQPQGTEEKGNYWVKSFCLPRLHWLKVINHAPKKFNGLYKGFASLSVSELASLTGLSLNVAKQAKKRDFGEPVHWLGDTADKRAFIEYLEHSGAQVLQGGRFFHVCGNADKGLALNWLSQLYQSHCGEDFCTIALGDSGNDIAMLEAATIAVQVRTPVHGFPALTRTAGVIQTEQFGPAGWAEALNQLLPELQRSNSIHTHSDSEVNHG